MIKLFLTFSLLGIGQVSFASDLNFLFAKQSRSTPRASSARDSADATGKLIRQLNELGAKGTTNCNRPGNAAQCLVCNCANEAGIEGYEGKVAVSRVVLSRVKHPKFRPTICGTVWQKSQFSWTIGAKNPGNNKLSKLYNNPNPRGKTFKDCVSSSKEAAKIELQERPSQLYAVNYYNNRIVRPKWAKTCSFVQQVGRHKFCNVRSARVQPVTPELTSDAIAYGDWYND